MLLVGIVLLTPICGLIAFILLKAFLPFWPALIGMGLFTICAFVGCFVGLFLGGLMAQALGGDNLLSVVVFVAMIPVGGFASGGVAVWLFLNHRKRAAVARLASDFD